MISAKNVEYMSNVPVLHLSAIAQNSGYKGCKYETATFLGLTNGGQWCYSVSFIEDGELQKGKVFLSYDPTADRVTLDF